MTILLKRGVIMTNNIRMIDLLQNVYIESRRKSDLNGISDIASKIEHPFSCDWNNLNYKQQWILHKYLHSIHVFETGVDIILSEKKLRSQPAKIKNDWYNALLMHDIGRADEINDSGKKILGYSHGAFGVEILNRNGVKSPYVLLPVLMHDKINFDISSLKPEDVDTDSRFSNVPAKTKAIIKKLLKQYHKMSSEEQENVRSGCKIVVDADQLANLKEYDKMFKLSRLPMRPVISKKVEQALKERHYANYHDLKTYPDEAIAYLSWMLYSNYPIFQAELIKRDIPNKIRQYVLKSIAKNSPKKDVELLDKKLRELQNIVEENLRSQITSTKNEVKQTEEQKRRIVARVLRLK